MGHVPLPPPPPSPEVRARAAAAALDREADEKLDAPASEDELERWHQIHEDARLAGADEDKCCRRADAAQARRRKKAVAQLRKEAAEWRERAKPEPPPKPGGLPAVAGAQIERDSRVSGATMATALSSGPPGRCVDCERQARDGIRMLLHDPATPIRVSAWGGPDKIIDTPNFLEVHLTAHDLERAARQKQFGGVTVDHNGVVNVKLPDGRIVAGQLHLDGMSAEAAHFTIVAHG